MPATAQPRIAKRMPCAVHLGGQRYSGVVLNVSQGGLFVQTNADPHRGSDLELELASPEAARTIPLRAKVVWKRVVPAKLRSVAHGGVGLQIQHADESYYVMLARWMRTELPAASAPPAPTVAVEAEPEMLSWRVRVRSSSGPRTRTLSIEAPTLEAAREEAGRYAGEGWRVIDVETL